MSRRQGQRFVGDLGDWSGGATPPKGVSAFWQGGSIPWVTPKDMGTSKITTAQDHLTPAGAAKLSTFLPGAIAVVFRSGVLKHSFPVARASVRFTVNQDLKVLQPASDVDSSYAFHALRGLEAEVLRTAVKSGTTVESVDLRVFLSLRTFVPPLIEQRRIAEILDAADETIRGTEAVIAKWRLGRAALLAALVPAEAAGAGWCSSPLGELVGGAEYGISSALADHGAVPVLRMMNLRDGAIDLSDLKYSSSEQAEALLLRPGDILFNRTNSLEHVGRTSLWRGEHRRASFASYCVRFVAKADKIVAGYLVHFMNLPAAQIRIKRLATPAVQQANINPTQLQRWFSVTYPVDLGVQQRAVEMLEAAEARIRAEGTYLDKVKLQKLALMQDLLTGRVRVAA